MGIKLLNTFWKSNFSKALERMHWSKMKNRKIVIDTNNYIYKFLSEDNLLESFIRMCDLFIFYKIVPLFIFDGKAPEDKMVEIKERKIEREKCKKIFHSIENNLTELEKIEMKRKIVKVTQTETEIVKKILDSYGMKYIVSPCESDELCCKLVNNRKVYACMSEDMDMFLYGCNRVIRLYNNTNYMYMYNMKNILNHMNITINSFKYLSFLGNLKKMPRDKNIFYYFKILKQYGENNFISYLLNNKIITNEQLDTIGKKMITYDIKKSDVLSKCNYILISRTKIDLHKISKLKLLRKVQLTFYPT